MNLSEKTSINKTSNDEYNATCIHCGGTKDIQLWPHRNGHGNMIGFVFACAGCKDVVRGVTMEIHGIRGHAEESEDEDHGPCWSCSDSLTPAESEPCKSCGEKNKKNTTGETA